MSMEQRASTIPDMAYVLEPTYGKQSVPVFKISKNGPKHSIIDMMIEIMLEGNVSASWTAGENHQIVPTETMKNTCYAIALLTDFTSIEEYGLALGADMLKRHTHLSGVKVWVEGKKWERVVVDGAPHNHVFKTSTAPEIRTCVVESNRSTQRIRSGVKDIKLMKTTQSGFDGFIRDQWTNLEPTGPTAKFKDRIMCTDMVAEWSYSNANKRDYNEMNEGIMNTLLANFAGPADTGRFSKSLQETVNIMATTVLDKYPDVDEIKLVTPNVHFYRFEVEKFGRGHTNPNIVFQQTNSKVNASGKIVTVLKRSKSKL